MRYLPDGKWMQKADVHMIQDIGIPSVVLMEHAAEKAVEIMEQEKIDCSRILVVSGAGNNGGDGFAMARLFAQKGKAVTVIFAGKEASLTPECRIQKQIVENMGIPVAGSVPDEDYTVVVDALFGVGLSREVSGSYAKLLQELNTLPCAKVAVDIPSGICAAEGKVLGTAFRADLTVAFQCEKLGTVLSPGREYAGKVITAEIGIDTDFYEEIPKISYTLEKDDLPKRLPARKDDSHKGTYGKVLMITGSKGMAGAAYLSAKAAYICGAGLVQIYTEESNRAILQQLLPEAIISAYEQYEPEQLKSLLKWADVVCIGCGLGQNRISESLLKGTLRNGSVPCVVDADGINLLACHPELLEETRMPLVLTPHMKEMSGMLGCSVTELQESRLSRIDAFVEKYPVVCALKDSRTIVAQKGRQRFVNTAGNHGMAKAGSGDVLSGVITGLLAGHLGVYDSAVLGVYLHACGGDAARKKLGSFSILAEDLIQGIGACLKEAEEQGVGAKASGRDIQEIERIGMVEEGKS